MNPLKVHWKDDIRSGQTVEGWMIETHMTDAGGFATIIRDKRIEYVATHRLTVGKKPPEGPLTKIEWVMTPEEQARAMARQQEFPN